MKRVFLGTILSVNIILMIVAGWILVKELTSPVSSAEKISSLASKSVKRPSGKIAKPVRHMPLKTRRSSKAAYISINTVPSSAKVFINGYFKAKTPADIKITSVTEVPRNYSVKLIKPGYLSWERIIKLSRGDTKEFSVKLLKK